MNKIGSEGFTIERTRINEEGKGFEISSTEEWANQYLYLNENQIDELINLLEKTKELL